jgi:hypothetical protein
MKRMSLMIALVIIFGLTATTYAALIEIDGWTVGDKRLTRDTNTGLDWMDLTVTVDKSIDNILVNHFGNLVDLGFRVATQTEVIGLFANAGAKNDAGEQFPPLPGR